MEEFEELIMKEANARRTRQDADQSVKALAESRFTSGLARRLRRKENNPMFVFEAFNGEVAEEVEVEDNTYDREYMDVYQELMQSYDDFKAEASNLKDEYKLLVEYFDLEWHKSIKNEQFSALMVEIETTVKIIDSLYEDGNLNKEKALHIQKREQHASVIGYKYLDRFIRKSLEALDEKELDETFRATKAKALKLKKNIEDIDAHTDEREIHRIKSALSLKEIAAEMNLDEETKKMLFEEWHVKDPDKKFSLEELNKIMKISMLKSLASNSSSDPNTKVGESAADEDKFLAMLKNHGLSEFFYENYSQYVPDKIQNMREMLQSAFYIAKARRPHIPVPVDVIDLDDDDDDRGVELGEETEKVHLNFVKTNGEIKWSPIFVEDDIVDIQQLESYRDGLINMMESIQYPELKEWMDKTQFVSRSDFMEEIAIWNQERLDRERVKEFTPTWSVEAGIESKSLKRVVDNLERAFNLYTKKLAEVEHEMAVSRGEVEAGPETKPLATRLGRKYESLETKFMTYTVKLKEIERRRKKLMARLPKIASHEINKIPLPRWPVPEELSDNAIKQYKEEIKKDKFVPIEDTSNVAIMLQEMLRNPELSQEAKIKAETLLKMAWHVATGDLNPSIGDLEPPISMIKYGAVKEKTNEQE